MRNETADGRSLIEQSRLINVSLLCRPLPPVHQTQREARQATFLFHRGLKVRQVLSPAFWRRRHVPRSQALAGQTVGSTEFTRLSVSGPSPGAQVQSWHSSSQNTTVSFHRTPIVCLVLPVASVTPLLLIHQVAHINSQRWNLDHIDRQPHCQEPARVNILSPVQLSF